MKQMVQAMHAIQQAMQAMQHATSHAECNRGGTRNVHMCCT